MLNYKNKYFPIALLLLFSCKEPTNLESTTFTIHILSPSHDQLVDSYPITIVTKVDNPDAIKSVDFFINDEIWCSTAPSDTIHLSYQPTNVSSEIDVEIKALGYNEDMDYRDSVTFSYISDSVSFFQDSTLAFLSNNNLSFQIMKFPVTNQLYSKYLDMVLSDSLVKYDTDIQAITGFSPGTEYISPGVYNFYVEEKGRITYNSGEIQIQSDYNLHPVTGVTWIGAMSFSSYFGWRIPSKDEWLEIVADTQNIERGLNLANFANNFGGTTPVGYFNGTNEGIISCTDLFNINGVYDLIGNVWEFTSSHSDFNPDYISACGGDFTSQLDSTIILSVLQTGFPFDIASSNFGFRCIADSNYLAQPNNWNGPDGEGIEDCMGECNGGTVVDCTGDCGGSAVADCTGQCNGSAALDECSNCLCNDSNHPNFNTGCTESAVCEQDCFGIFGGDAEQDACGECGGTIFDEELCVCDDDLIRDDCGLCGGNNYYKTPGDSESEWDCGINNENCDNVDCAGFCGGPAEIDCNNECGGSAFESECGCIEGNTGEVENWCIGCNYWYMDDFICDDITSDNKCCQEDPGNDENRCKIDSDNSCNYSTSICEKEYETDEEGNLICDESYLVFVDGVPISGWVLCNDNDETNDIYIPTGYITFDNIGCENNDDTCCDEPICDEPFTLFLSQQQDVAGIIEVNYSSDVEIGGFEFDISGVTITDVFGGATEQYGLTSQALGNSILAFSLESSTIPAGEGILTNLAVTVNDDNICIQNVIVSDPSGFVGINVCPEYWQISCIPVSE